MINKTIFVFCLLSSINIIQGKINFSYRTNPYSTHQPILYEIATKTTGPIIEFGCGAGSTDLLHEICKKTDRQLISLDDNLEWLNVYKKKYKGKGYNEDNSGWHKFYFVPGRKNGERPDHWIKFFQEAEWLQTLNPDVCFIDQSPWLARYETIKLMKNKARYILLHDCGYFPFYGVFGKVIKWTDTKNQIPGVFDFSDTFKHFKVYFTPSPWPLKTGPPTLVASNFESNFPMIDYSNY